MKMMHIRTTNEAHLQIVMVSLFFLEEKKKRRTTILLKIETLLLKIKLYQREVRVR